MANLSIPFLLLQPATCRFEPEIKTTKIYGYDQYNVPRPGAAAGHGVQQSVTSSIY